MQRDMDLTSRRLLAVARRWEVVAGLSWLVRYATLARMPWQTPTWAGWFDQGRYLASAVAFSHGDLSAAAHWYPLGYPLIASPFVWLLPGDPFFLLDLLLFLLTCRGFQRVVARLGIGSWPATWCFLAATVIQTGLASAWAQPWTTTLSAAAIWWLIDRTIILCEPHHSPHRRSLVAAGVLMGALPLIRPVDALLSATCAAIIVVYLFRRRRLSAGAVLALMVGSASVCVPYALLHFAIYGPHPTAYMITSAKMGFVFNDLGWKAQVLLVDPEPWYPGSRSILQVLPWLVPGCAGLIAYAVTGRDEERRVIAVLFTMIVPVSAIMLTYADLQPPGLWYFGNVHYFKWAMPAFAAGILLATRLLFIPAGRRVLALAALPLVVALGIRITPVAVDERTPARLLMFRGDTHRNWQEAYFAPVVISDQRGSLRNIFDFHQIPDAAGERAIAISRLFGNRPRRTDPGEPRLKRNQVPYRRFAERVTLFGLP